MSVANCAPYETVLSVTAAMPRHPKRHPSNGVCCPILQRVLTKTHAITANPESLRQLFFLIASLGTEQLNAAPKFFLIARRPFNSSQG